MKLSYFRKSTSDYKTTVENVKKQAKQSGLTAVGETVLPSGKATFVYVADPVWSGNLIASDKNLIGLLPGVIAVIEKEGAIEVGVGSAAVLGGVSEHPAVRQLASQVEKKLQDLVNNAAGVGPLKVAGLKLYSTMTCPYCKAEAAWLTDKKIPFDEVHVDLDQKAGEEMVKKTGQMGVPVTEVRYEDGEEEYIVGFDQARLASLFPLSA